MQYVRSYGWKQSSLVCLVLATLAAGEVFAQQSQVVPGQPYVVEAPLVPTSGEMSGQVPYAAGQVLTATGQPHLQRPYPDNSATSLPPLPTMVQHAANWQIGASQRRRVFVPLEMLLGDVSPQDFPREENPQRPEGIQQAAEFTPVLTSAPATAGGATGLSEEDNPFVDDPLEEPVAPQTTTPAVDDGQATPDVPAEDPFGLESDEEDPFGGF